MTMNLPEELTAVSCVKRYSGKTLYMSVGKRTKTSKTVSKHWNTKDLNFHFWCGFDVQTNFSVPRLLVWPNKISYVDVSTHVWQSVCRENLSGSTIHSLCPQALSQLNCNTHLSAWHQRIWWLLTCLYVPDRERSRDQVIHFKCALHQFVKICEIVHSNWIPNQMNKNV